MNYCSSAVGVILLMGAFPCFAAKEVCHSTAIYEYYCDDGYYCCQSNTKCCWRSISSGSSGSSNAGLIAGAVIGGIAGLIFLGAVCVNVCNFINKQKTTVQPDRGQENNTAQQPQQQMYNTPAFQSSRTNPPLQIGSPPVYVA